MLNNIATSLANSSIRFNDSKALKIQDPKTGETVDMSVHDVVSGLQDGTLSINDLQKAVFKNIKDQKQLNA